MGVHRAAPVDERSLFARYPFLPGAAQLLAEYSPSIGALFRERRFDPAKAAGRARIRTALDDPTGGTEVPGLGDLGEDERFLSFQFARLLLSTIPQRAPIRRWAVAEAKAAGHRLEREPDETLVEVGRRLGYELSIEGERVRIPLPGYLRLATPIREVDYRLARQALSMGSVEVPRARAVRLLEEGIRIALTEPEELAEGTRGAIVANEPEFFEELARRLPALPERGRAAPGALSPDRFPPCIRGMQATLEAGENLSHSGRFALAAFLHRAGASYETIVDAYRGAPDFDESVTRYQVEHIRRKDDGAGYEPPDCATLRSHGLCLRDGVPASPVPALRTRDPLCFEPWLRHPLQYYRKRGEAVGAPAPAGPASPTVPPGGREGSGTPPAPGRPPSTGPR
jgi:DNA primase large subunit